MDLPVEEVNCVECLAHEHTAQGPNDWRASGRAVCLLVNFQKPKVEWKRMVQGFQVPEPMELTRQGCALISLRDMGVEGVRSQEPE